MIQDNVLVVAEDYIAKFDEDGIIQLPGISGLFYKSKTVDL